jgi:predicted nucleic-acid-binding Zn-ribbon protein
METYPCPRCKEPMDEGRMHITGSEHAYYISNKQTGWFKESTYINLARACPNCGYVEMYLDPQKLKQKIS